MDALQGGGTGLPDSGNAFWLGHVPLVGNKIVQTNTGMAQTGWVDDVLLPGPTKQETESNVAQLIDILTELGNQFDQEKSMTQAAQSVRYLRVSIDFNDH